MGESAASVPGKADGLHRHFGLLHAVALNVTLMIGTGVFASIPLMIHKLPGPYALLGWLVGGLLMLADGLIWSELGAALPGSGGSYVYLLECFGRERWGRLMAFLFLWQFLISVPLEAASGLIAMAQFAGSLSRDFAEFNANHTWQWGPGQWEGINAQIAIGPTRLVFFVVGIALIVLAYRHITVLGKLTITFWIGVLAAIAWVLIEGARNFDPQVAFHYPEDPPQGLAFFQGLGGATILAMYCYLGYYSVCYIGDEVRDPGRTVPRAILLSSLLVFLLYVALHLAMLGTVSWTSVPKETENYSLPAKFMERSYDHWAVVLVTLLIIWSSLGSTFASLVSYSRVPYGAARYGHFFAVLGRIHPVHRIPHISLLVVGGLTLFWSFFELGTVIDALITTRILSQFVAQIVGVMLLRRHQPERPRPFRMWLYPLPCGLALLGWLCLYVSAGRLFIQLGLATMGLGLLAFLLWARRTKGWPFGLPVVSRATTSELP